jgi:predicted Zn-dependent protease with MMP-like domain
MGQARAPFPVWSDVRSPSLEDFIAMSAAAWENIPETFRALCDDLIIKVAEFPSNEVVEDMNLESPFDVMGLFEGVGMAYGSATSDTGEDRNIIHLYRRPILDYWAEHDETLGDIVSHVLIHEIGHHFGLSDDDMEDIESRSA